MAPERLADAVGGGEAEEALRRHVEPGQQRPDEEQPERAAAPAPARRAATPMPPPTAPSTKPSRRPRRCISSESSGADSIAPVMMQRDRQRREALVRRQHLPGQPAEDEGHRQLRPEHHLRRHQHPEVAAGADRGDLGRGGERHGPPLLAPAGGSERRCAARRARGRRPWSDASSRPPTDVAEGAALARRARAALRRGAGADRPAAAAPAGGRLRDAVLGASSASRSRPPPPTAIWNRLEAIGATTPAGVLAATDEALRAAGLSRQKVAYGRAIAGERPRLRRAPRAARRRDRRRADPHQGHRRLDRRDLRDVLARPRRRLRPRRPRAAGRRAAASSSSRRARARRRCAR